MKTFNRYLMLLALVFAGTQAMWAQDEVTVAPTANANEWTLAAMPDFDVELEVVYYEEPELAWTRNSEEVPATSVTTYMGFPFTAPTLVNPHLLAPTYQSTSTSVATIDANGVLTILAPGTTTIKAIFAGDDTYREDTASYLLTVLAPVALTIASNNSEWGTVAL